MTRGEILAVPCPFCRAEAGEPCHEGGRAVAPHNMRIVQAELRAHWRTLAPKRRPSMRERNRKYGVRR